MDFQTTEWQHLKGEGGSEIVYILRMMLKKVFFRGDDDFRKSVSTILKMLAAGFWEGKPHPQNSNTLEATKKKKKKKKKKEHLHTKR